MRLVTVHGFRGSRVQGFTVRADVGTESSPPTEGFKPTESGLFEDVFGYVRHGSSSVGAGPCACSVLLFILQ